jgi:hypothetical protein
MSANIEGLWFDDSIHCTLQYSPWLNFTVHYYTHSSVCSHIFIATAQLQLPMVDTALPLGSQTIPVPQLPDWLQLLTGPGYLHRWDRKRLSHYSCVLLLSWKHACLRGCCIVACFAVVAWHQICISQYDTVTAVDLNIMDFWDVKLCI